MQQSNQPAKFILPIAQNDASKADIPVTTADASRASQSLGFPPLTGQPPEAGGVPPQLPDMNGLLNAISRIPWWAMLGGRFGYDSAFATNVNINGYPLGAELASADGLGSFFSTIDNNVSNPDTNGAGWAPGFHYGATALAGQTGGNVTLTQAQAAKKVITVAGTLTSNLVLIVPAWRYDWTVYNNTSGAFSVSVRTAGGSAAAIPQNGAPTPVVCDGTNCSLLAPNFGSATSATQAARLDQVGGRLLGVRRFATVGTSTYTPTPGTASVVVEVVGAGASGAGTVAAPSGQAASGGGGGGGAFAKARITSGFSGLTVTVGAGGVSAAGQAGQAGGSSSFGSLVVCPGGAGGPQAAATATANYGTPGLGAQGPTFGGGVEVIVGASGAAGAAGAVYSAGVAFSGTGANTPYGTGSSGTGSSGTGQSGTGQGAGGQGAGGAGGFSTAGGAPGGGGAGANGLVLIWEYA